MALNLTAVIGIVMHGIVQGFSDDIPLERQICGASGGKALIRRPRDRAVIDNGMVARGHAHAAVRGAIAVTDTHTDIADHNILRAHRAEIIVYERDAVAGGGLSCHIDIAAVLRDAERILQRNDAAHVKDDRPRSLERTQTVAERTLLAVFVQIGDVVHGAAAAAACKSPVALGCRKRRTRDLEAVHCTRHDAPVLVHLIDTPVIRRHRGIALVKREFRRCYIAPEFRGGCRCFGHGSEIRADVDVVACGIGTSLPGKSVLTQEMRFLILRQHVAD